MTLATFRFVNVETLFWPVGAPCLTSCGLRKLTLSLPRLKLGMMLLIKSGLKVSGLGAGMASASTTVTSFPMLS